MRDSTSALCGHPNKQILPAAAHNMYLFPAKEQMQPLHFQASTVGMVRAGGAGTRKSASAQHFELRKLAVVRYCSTSSFLVLEALG